MHTYNVLNFSRSNDDLNTEMQHCFPTISGQQRRTHPYIPRHTYTPPMRPGRIQHPHRQSSVVSISKSFTRDVVLLAPSESCVPREGIRSRLHDEGRVANMVDFMSCWDEDKMRKRIEDCFQGILDMNKSYPRYVSTCKQRLIVCYVVL